MKREVRLIILSILAGFLVLVFGSGEIILNAQQAASSTTGTAKTQEKKTQQTGLVEDWMNDFESCEDWRATSTCPLGDTKIRKIPGKPRPVDSETGQVVETPEQYTDDNGINHKAENVLGVKSYFMDRGYDRVEVFPPNEYIVRGKAKELKVWALGRKFRHTLYVKLRDFKGKLHKVKVGRLDFWGWRELTVIIPGWLPQAASYAMLDKNLHFVSFYVQSDLYEAPGTFYFYLDNFRMVTDLSEFTGDTSIRDSW